MNREDGIVTAVRTRRALNDLQYSPNGKDIVGLSNNQNKANQKKVCFYWITFLNAHVVLINFFI